MNYWINKVTQGQNRFWSLFKVTEILNFKYTLILSHRFKNFNKPVKWQIASINNRVFCDVHDRWSSDSGIRCQNRSKKTGLIFLIGRVTFCTSDVQWNLLIWVVNGNRKSLSFFYTGSVALYLVHGNQGKLVLKTGDALTEQLWLSL